MKSLQKILKISARYAFKNLRKNSPFFCEALQEKVFVTRIFWNHINFSRLRTTKDEISRLSSLPILEEIFKYGKLKEERKDNNEFYKISLPLEEILFTIIILRDKKKSSKLFLLSCFVDLIQKK